MLTNPQEQLLARALKDSPTRTVDNFGKNIIGQIVVAKAPRPLQFESLLECSHIIRRERDPRVVRILDQPLTIPIVYEGKRSSRETVHYPDFLVEWGDGVSIEEVKTLKRMQQDRRFAEKRRQAELFAAKFEAQYWVFTEMDQGPQPLSSNLDFLFWFRFVPDALPTYERQLLDAVKVLPGRPVLELASAVDPKNICKVLPCIWHLLYSGRLCADLVTTEIRKGVEHTLGVYPGLCMQVDAGPYQLPMKPFVA